MVLSKFYDDNIEYCIESRAENGKVVFSISLLSKDGRSVIAGSEVRLNRATAIRFHKQIRRHISILPEKKEDCNGAY